MVGISTYSIELIGIIQAMYFHKPDLRLQRIKEDVTTTPDTNLEVRLLSSHVKQSHSCTDR